MRNHAQCARYWWFRELEEIEIITIDILFLRFFPFLFYRQEAQHLEEIDCLCFWLFGVLLFYFSFLSLSPSHRQHNSTKIKRTSFFLFLVKKYKRKTFLFLIKAAGQNEVRKNLPLDRNRDLLTTFAAIPQQHYGGGGTKGELVCVETDDVYNKHQTE